MNVDLQQWIDARRAELSQQGNAATIQDRIAKRRAEIQSPSRNNDGTYGQPPEGVVMDPGTGQMIDAKQRDEFDQRVLSEFPVAAPALEFVQGAPFVGEWIDEGVEKISPEAAQRAQAFSDAMERQRPGQSAALNITGGVTATLPLAVGTGATKALDFIAKGSNMLTRGVRAGAVAAPAGAVEGAASFSGRANEGQRVEEGAKGAMFGGALAALLGPAASMSGEGLVNFARRIKGLDTLTIMEEFGLTPAAARTVRQALDNDDLDAAIGQMSKLSDDAMLADAGPSTAALLDASANTGGTALKTARDATERRAAKVGQHIPRVLDAVFGKPKGIKTVAREISQSTAAGRQRAYQMAYTQPIDYASPAGRNIEGALSRIPSKTLEAAIAEANEAMTAAGQRNLQIMAQIADDGSVTFREMPNVQQLDEIKKALDSMARESVDQFGRQTAKGVRARNLARDLREALKEANPIYGRALRIGGDKVQQDEGLALGKNLLFKRTTVEDVEAFLNQGVSNEARQALRQGVRDSIEQNLSNVRRTISDPNTDAREAMQLVKEMSSRANTEKLRLILGGPRTDRLLNELDRAATALDLRAAVAQNSKTAIRQSIQGQVAHETQPGLLRDTIGNIGNPLEAARKITRQVASVDPRSLSRREKAMFDEIAEALVGIQGQEAREALIAVKRAMAGQPLKDAQAELIGRVVAGSGALGLYQSGMRSLESSQSH